MHSQKGPTEPHSSAVYRQFSPEYFFHDHLTSPAHSMYLIQYSPVHIAKKTPSFCGTASSQWRYLTCYHQEEVLWNLG